MRPQWQEPSSGSAELNDNSSHTWNDPQSYTKAHLHLPSLVILSLLLCSTAVPKPPPQLTETYTHRTPTRANRRCLTWIIWCLPASSCWHDDLVSRRYWLRSGFVPLRGSEKVVEIRVEDDEPSFEDRMWNEPTEAKKRIRMEVKKWRMAQCWDLAHALVYTRSSRNSGNGLVIIEHTLCSFPKTSTLAI